MEGTKTNILFHSIETKQHEKPRNMSISQNTGPIIITLNDNDIGRTSR